MTEQHSLVQLLLEQVIEQTRDQRPMLTDIARRIEPFTTELIQSWTQVYREARVREPLPPEDVIRGIQSAAVALFFGGLKSGDLRQYFTDFAAWGEQITLSGLSFDRVLKLLREYQRSGIPFLMRAYPSGPELQAAFNALDQLFGALVTLLAGTYIQSAQAQLIYGARSRTLGQLATGASHALYGVLTAIAGRTQLMEELARDPELRYDLDELRHSAGVGAEMARRLQEFARAGDNEPPTLCDVNSLMSQAADMTRFAWRDQAEMDGIVIDIVKDFAEMPPVNVRASEIRAVFIELIMNAVEAMPQGGVITLRSERRGEQVLASVMDHGEGMDEATRLRVFDSFFTTKAAPHPGLGLSSAASIVTQYNGTLTVESQLGQGSTFTVALAVADSEEPAPATPPVSMQTLNILFIDDDPAQRDLVRKFLARHGYPVTAEDNGTDGMNEVRRRLYDLVFADLGMPGMSGWEIAKKIREFHHKTLVVLMTPWAVELDEDKVRASGAHRVVRKPVKLDQLLTIIQEAALLKEKMK